MPLSYDHTVHLARIVEQARALGQGHLSTWSTQWFFGAPIGELYPPLGDLLVIGLRALSVGTMSWSAAYALGFFVVFSAQGWAMLYCARRLGLGRFGAATAGIVAAAIVLLDPGFMREGGWMYTVTFGVWPQALSTTLLWVGFGALASASRSEPARTRRRDLARAAMAIAGAMLAHPVALPGLAIGAPLLALFTGRDAMHRGAMVLSALAGLGIAAFWVLPMLQHRAWMASYGWLFASLDHMATLVIDRGQWAQDMAPAAGRLAGLAMVAVAGVAVARVVMRRGSEPFTRSLPSMGFATFVAAFSLTTWALASRDAFWELRLDRVSEGFAHIQYQRFLILAKPGLALLAGAAVGTAAHLAFDRGKTTVGIRAPSGPTGLVAASILLAMLGWLGRDLRTEAREHQVGSIETRRLDPHGAVIEDDYRAMVRWLSERVGPGQRVAFSEPRNTHWFMDATAYGVPGLYKIGFTPGDNFVHKPEAGTRAILDRLQVAWIVRRSTATAALPGEVARFGTIRIVERKIRQSRRPSYGSGWIRARVEGPRAGERGLVVSSEGPLHLEFELDEPAPAKDLADPVRVVFDVAGYPRWKLEVDGRPQQWFEVPAVAQNGAAATASVAARERGELRGGRAQGDTGREPLLIAADVPPGATVRLSYQARTLADVVADLVSLACLLVVAPIAIGQGRGRRVPAALRRGFDRLRPVAAAVGDRRVLATAAALLAVTVGWRWNDARVSEVDHAFGRVTALERARVEPLKTDMLIRPAVVLRPKQTAPASAEIPDVPCGEELTGWAAIDDDRGKRRSGVRSEIMVEMPSDDGTQPVPLARVKVPHRPGRQVFAVTAACDGRTNLRVRATTSGAKPLPIGFDLSGLDGPVQPPTIQTSHAPTKKGTPE
jgi:hypothetical protein